MTLNLLWAFQTARPMYKNSQLRPIFIFHFFFFFHNKKNRFFFTFYSNHWTSRKIMTLNHFSFFLLIDPFFLSFQISCTDTDRLQWIDLIIHFKLWKNFFSFNQLFQQLKWLNYYNILSNYGFAYHTI